MKRYKSAFAVPSGFAVASGQVGKSKAGRRSDAILRGVDMPTPSATPVKPRAARDIRNRAA